MQFPRNRGFSVAQPLNGVLFPRDEAFFTPDGSEVWVTVRGENYISVLSGKTYDDVARIIVPNGPGMQIFSPDGKYGYVCSSFTPEIEVITVADHRIVAHLKQDSPFCPNIAATPDGKQVWFTLKDIGRTQIFNARPPFALLKTLDTGPITNHVNFAHNANGTFAYVMVGGLNEVKVFRTTDFSQVAVIPVGNLPHGIWPSGDGRRVYVGLKTPTNYWRLILWPIRWLRPFQSVKLRRQSIMCLMRSRAGPGEKTCNHSALLARRRI